MYDLGRQFHIDISKLKSKSESIVAGSNYRCTVHSERLIRLEYSKDNRFNDYATELVTFRDFDKANFTVLEDSKNLQITTPYFKLVYLKGTSITSSKNLKVYLNNTDKVWYYNHPEIRNFYGNSINLT